MSSGSEASLCSQQPGLNTRDRIGDLRSHEPTVGCPITRTG
jgi:hypothetical protein